MISVKAENLSLQTDFSTGEMFFRATISPAHRRAVQVAYADLRDKSLRIDLKEWRDKRSLDANAYLWLLVTKIAEAVRSDKDSVYLEMLKRYGQGGVVKIPNDKVDLFKRAYKYHEPHEKLSAEEKAQYFRFWVGSSEYDSKEMSVLIDGVISDAEELGIPTIPDDELTAMKARWP